jgi:hypothetical protein
MIYLKKTIIGSGEKGREWLAYVVEFFHGATGIKHRVEVVLGAIIHCPSKSGVIVGVHAKFGACRGWLNSRHKLSAAPLRGSLAFSTPK